jgi:hypothetical protein
VLVGVGRKFLKARTTNSHDFRAETCYSFLFIYGAGMQPRPPFLRPFIGRFYNPWMIYGDDCGAICIKNGSHGTQGKYKHSEQTRP